MLAFLWFPKHTSHPSHVLPHLPDTVFFTLSKPLPALLHKHMDTHPQQSRTCTPAFPTFITPPTTKQVEPITIGCHRADTFTSMVFTTSCNYTFLWIIISLQKLFNDLRMQKCIFRSPTLNTETVM